jgi:hypothetical protein
VSSQPGSFVTPDDNSCDLLPDNVFPILVLEAASQKGDGKPIERMGRRRSCMQLDNANLHGTLSGVWFYPERQRQTAGCVAFGKALGDGDSR